MGRLFRWLTELLASTWNEIPLLQKTSFGRSLSENLLRRALQWFSFGDRGDFTRSLHRFRARTPFGSWGVMQIR